MTMVIEKVKIIGSMLNKHNKNFWCKIGIHSYEMGSYEYGKPYLKRTWKCWKCKHRKIELIKNHA